MATLAEIVTTWTPAPGKLFSLPETTGAISYPISCVVALAATALPTDIAPTVTAYAATISPIPTVDVLRLTPSASALTVSAKSLAGLFGFDFIDYREGDAITRIHSWGDLPDTADIVEFRPSHDASRDFTLAVTATLSDKRTVSATYTLQILQDWSAGSEKLRSAVNARSNQTR